MSAKTIHSRIKELLNEHCMMQKELGARIGVTESQVSHLLAGNRNPSMGTLQRIADAFGLTLSDFLKGVRV